MMNGGCVCVSARARASASVCVGTQVFLNISCKSSMDQNIMRFFH